MFSSVIVIKGFAVLAMVAVPGFASVLLPVGLEIQGFKEAFVLN